MRMQIDESGRHHQPLDVQHPGAWQRAGRHRRDLAAADRHLPHRIHSRRRVHHAAVGQDQVVLLRRECRDRHEREEQPHVRLSYRIGRSQPWNAGAV